MDKELLIEALENIGTSSYSWALYFFKIDRRNNNPYTTYKVTQTSHINLAMHLENSIPGCYLVVNV